MFILSIQIAGKSQRELANHMRQAAQHIENMTNEEFETTISQSRHDATHH